MKALVKAMLQPPSPPAAYQPATFFYHLPGWRWLELKDVGSGGKENSHHVCLGHGLYPTDSDTF